MLKKQNDNCGIVVFSLFIVNFSLNFVIRERALWGFSGSDLIIKKTNFGAAAAVFIELNASETYSL